MLKIDSLETLFVVAKLAFGSFEDPNWTGETHCFCDITLPTPNNDPLEKVILREYALSAITWAVTRLFTEQERFELANRLLECDPHRNWQRQTKEQMAEGILKYGVPRHWRLEDLERIVKAERERIYQEKKNSLAVYDEKVIKAAALLNVPPDEPPTG